MYYYCSLIRRTIPDLMFFCDGDDTLMFVPPDQETRALEVAQGVANALSFTVKFENRCEPGGRGILFC